jgi:hypothetical protein
MLIVVMTYCDDHGADGDAGDCGDDDGGMVIVVMVMVGW